MSHPSMTTDSRETLQPQEASPATPAPPAASIRRVLIYRLGSLGDMVVALPCMHLIARAFPNADRRMLTNFPVDAKAPAAQAVLGTPDAVPNALVHGYFQYTASSRNCFELLRLWWQIFRWRPQVVVYLAAARGVPVARRDTRFFRACGIQRLVGVPLTPAMQQNFYGNATGQGFATSVPGALVLGADWEPEAERLARCIASLGDARPTDPASWDLQLTEAERAAARTAIGPQALNAQPIAVSIGTKVQAKDWGAGNWHQLLSRMALDTPGRALILLGAASESAASETAAAGWQRNGGGPVINLCGRLTPRESAAALESMTFFVGHDSGPMHLAAAVGTPCVAIFAARNMPRVWFPFGPQHRVLYHAVDCAGCALDTCIERQKRCLTSITVDEVLTATRELAGL